MTTLADYTPEEVKLLTETPFAVGMAVMLAGKSGLGSIKEAAAIAAAVMSGRQQYPNNALIQSLVSTLEAQTKQDRKAAQATMNPLDGQKVQPDQVMPLALEQARQVSDLLAAKSDAQETAEYKQWLMAIADKVANAAKEGDFIGIGGVRVSEPEKAAMAQFTEALGINA